MPVSYQFCGHNGVLTPGTGQMVTLDIGGGGFKFRMDHRVEAGDILYVHLPLEPQPFFSMGRVVWADASRLPGRFLAGLHFIDLSEVERSRLIRFLAQTSGAAVV
jgi:hypothetical protein